MPTIRLTWDELNNGEDGHRVYRSATPMDPEALPAHLAELGPDVVTYDDDTVVDGNTYYYRVSAYKGAVEKVSEELEALASAGDPYWANVVSLIHPSGADGSTTFTDETGLRTWTRFGNAQVDTDIVPFAGGSAILMDGSGDYLSTPHTGGLDLTGDFTIEFFMRTTTTSVIKSAICKRESAAVTNNAYWCLMFPNGEMGFFANNAIAVGTNLELRTGAGYITTNTWYHYAATREGDVWRLFIDGFLVDSLTAAVSMRTNTQPLWVGRDPSSANGGGRDWQGSLSNVRITDGVARYTANFTPPTKPFPRHAA